MKRFMTKLGACLILATAVMIVGSTSAGAQTPIDPPECLAPCFFDQSTGQLICPCDTSSNNAIPEPMTLALLASGLIGGAYVRRKRS